MTMNEAYISELCAQQVKFDISHFPEELLPKPFWLLWTAEFAPTAEKPYKFLKNPLGHSWQKNRTLFDDLPAPSSNQGYGFLYNNEHEYVCVDLDLATPLNDRLARSLDSYTEWSPSGAGLHIIVAVNSLADKVALEFAFGKGKRNKQEARDLFISSGYVTITGLKPPLFTHPEIRRFNVDDLISILSPYFTSSVITHPSVKAKAESAASNKQDANAGKALSAANEKEQLKQLSEAQIKQLLQAIPVKCLTSDAFVTFPLLDSTCEEEARDAWLVVGQALHHHFAGSLSGFLLWREWSMRGNKYDEKALEASWKSFEESSGKKIVTIASLVKLVKSQQPVYPDVNKDGRPRPSLQNLNVFTAFNKIIIRHNTTSHNLEVIFPPHIAENAGIESTPVISKTAVTEVYASELTRQGFIESYMRQALRGFLIIQSQQSKNEYNPVLEYFQKDLVTWDGRDRVHALLDTLNPKEEDKPAYLLYLRKWLVEVIAAVHSTYTKPNRLNAVLILQGPQGTGKTAWVESLFPSSLREYCVGSKTVKMSMFRTDMVKLNMELLSTLICNINEIDTVFNDKTYSDFKAFLDQTTDSIVLPYGDAAIKTIRRTVFIGSTNRDRFLKDDTGNRRVMIIKSNSFNYQHKINIDQLWAQAQALYLSGESWWLDPEKHAEVIKEQTKMNLRALDIENEQVIDTLDSLFAIEAPREMWQTYTGLTEIRRLLGLSTTTSSIEFNRAKKSFIQWLREIGAPAPYYKHTGDRAPKVYTLPPLRGSYEDSLEQKPLA